MENRLLSKLIEQNIISCPNCTDNHLLELNDKLICSKCDALFSKNNGVVDFNNYCSDDNDTQEILISPDTILSLIDKLSIHNLDNSYSRVEDIYRRSFKKTNDVYQSAEINCVMARFDIENEEEYNEQQKSNLVESKITAQPADGDFNIAYERHYFEENLPLNSTIYRNVRIKNKGVYKWSSTVDQPIFLSYHWINKEGRFVVWEGERTPFPIDVLPMRAITLPLKINTPSVAGRYTLQIAIVQEGVKWTEQTLDIPVLVENIDTILGLSYLKVNSDYTSYEEDHELARRIVEEFIEDHGGYQESLLLEVGGSTHPQLAFIRSSCDVVNIDISAPTLELGSLYFSHHTQKQNLCFICCDATKAPFRECSFDGIVMFSTLHHFSEPEQLLIQLSKTLKKDGFMAIMCEPVGNDLSHDAAVRDLLSGINEQIFTIEEYLSIFKNSRLIPTFVRVDGGSLKAILQIH